MALSIRRRLMVVGASVKLGAVSGFCSIAAIAGGPLSDAALILAQAPAAKIDDQSLKDRTKAMPPTKEGIKGSRKRGRLPDLTTVCEVTPPCPVGCKEDVRNATCVDHPPP
jgi:hypothetical protein